MLHKTSLEKVHMYQDVQDRQHSFYEAIRGLMSPVQPVNPTIPRPLSPTTGELETVLMPAVKPEPVRKQPTPCHIFRQHVSNHPLMMLFDAVIACNRQFGRVPDALFVSKDLLPSLQQETETLTGYPFDGHFRMFYPKAINGRFKMFPVFPEAVLPDALRIAYGALSIDAVIAIVER